MTNRADAIAAKIEAFIRAEVIPYEKDPRAGPHGPSDELVQELRAQGTAFLVVSHYQQLIESLMPDAVLRLDQGCIAETGDVGLAGDIGRTGFVRAAETLDA